MQHRSSHEEQPGYGDLLRHRHYLWKNRHRLADPGKREELAVLARINDKLHAYEWVQARGHAVVPHRVYPSLADALQENRLDRFVLKPAAGGRGSRGVYLLRRRFWGGYTCAMTGRHYASDKGLIAHYASLQANPKAQTSKEVILEEYVEDSLGYDVPLDYKVLAFACGTPVVMQRYAPAHIGKAYWGFEFYNENGQRLGPIRCDVSSGERWNLRAPADLPKLFQMARAIIAEAQVSFVRIDLYSTPSGPMFGEFTPVPNKAKESYVPAYDRLLGDLWLQSLEALGLDYGAHASIGRPSI